MIRVRWVLYVVHTLKVQMDFRLIQFSPVGSKGRVGDLAIGLLVSNKTLNLLLLFKERRELHILALVREQSFKVLWKQKIWFYSLSKRWILAV